MPQRPQPGSAHAQARHGRSLVPKHGSPSERPSRSESCPVRDDEASRLCGSPRCTEPEHRGAPLLLLGAEVDLVHCAVEAELKGGAVAVDWRAAEIGNETDNSSLGHVRDVRA